MYEMSKVVDDMCLIGSGRGPLAIAPGASGATPIADGIAAPPFRFVP
jgi:hypothetical protein